jgi:hypothetical protein
VLGVGVSTGAPPLTMALAVPSLRTARRPVGVPIVRPRRDGHVPVGEQ